MALSHPLLYRIVAGYRLTDYVGAGGMGEVFKAYHAETGRLAAVKILYRPEFKARFQNEAIVQSSLTHPNIARLYEYSQLDERPVLIIEWVDGQSLDEVIRRKKRLTNNEASLIIRQIISAVSYVHQAGIIHRDLKPSNVRITPDGQVKILDFGIAKGKYTPQLTQVGYVVGTTEFMAPEQFRGRVDAKSDIWALGILLYEITTGHLPFDDSNPMLLRQQIERGSFTRPHVLNPSISPELASIIANCLQTNPSQRPSGADILQNLDREKTIERNRLVESISSLSDFSLKKWPSVAGYWPWLIVLTLGIVGVNLTKRRPVTPEEKVVAVVDSTPQYEKILVEVLNADYDLELISPDGTVQSKEPFQVQRIPGQPLSITIRHRGAEQQFTIEPGVKSMYQCYFDR